MASGKGGAGKTTVAASIALFMADKKSVAYLDCDVEEPNGHLLLHPVFNKQESVSVSIPQIIDEKCDHCGYCADICAFSALVALPGATLVFSEMCHGCGGCWLFCPHQAIMPAKKTIGVVEEGHAANIRFVRGKLNVGVAISPPLITAVKQKIKEDEFSLIDVPPGTSCPVVKAVEGADCCILVTEPTRFGLHDLDLSVKLMQHLNIPCGVVVNRSDGADVLIEDYCNARRIPLLQRLPLDRKVAEGYAVGVPAAVVRPDWRDLFDVLMRGVEELVS